MKKINNQSGITLVALVITIIILLILAGIAITQLTGDNGLFVRAKQAKNNTLDAQNAENATLTDYVDKIDEVLGKTENQTPISKTEPKVGYYADIDGNGTVDGVIYADLAVGTTGSGQWGDVNGDYSIPIKTGLKDYYISQKDYNGTFGTKDVISPIKTTTGEERFYVMALNYMVKDGKDDFDWYNAADGKMDDYSTTTYGDFGEGKTNTETMISKWNAEEYGEKDKCSSHKDIWGQIQTEFSKGWFVPSRGEWSALAGELGISSNSYEMGLYDDTWTSSQCNESEVYEANFEADCFDEYTVDYPCYVRLSTTF